MIVFLFDMFTLYVYTSR